VRLPPDFIRTLDTWPKHNGLSRSAAMRTLMERGLGAAPPLKRPTPHTAAKASERVAEMAAERIGKLLSPLLPETEQRTRKRRLIKGPREFREMRGKSDD
jgi:hypothetical protein